MAPPRSMYLGCTWNTCRGLLRSVKSQAPKQTASAVSCTKALAVQMLEDLVTWVLNTPWILIRAPEIKAIKKPIMGYTFLSEVSSSVYPMIGKICM